MPYLSCPKCDEIAYADAAGRPCPRCGDELVSSQVVQARWSLQAVRAKARKLASPTASDSRARI